VRKWLTYLALTIAATIMIGDAIFFLQSFLHGDLSIRFVLDMLVLFLIVGVIFAYYLSALRGRAVWAPRNRVFTAASLVLVVFALVCGFVNLGSPGRQRSLSFDERRVSDLTRIEARIASIYRIERGLPAALPANIEQRDPQTGLPYEYERIDGRRYRLCADFAAPGSPPFRPTFIHPAGHTCFTLAADGAVRAARREAGCFAKPSRSAALRSSRSRHA
jgi:hypothetical protein